MKVSASLPNGVAALFFESARRRRRLEAGLATRLEEAGFREVVLPVVDYLDPYEEILSPESRQELFRLIGRDGEVLALRADFTPMLARLIAPRLPSLELPLRLFYRGDVLRYQEEKPGRARELCQLGAEVLGLEGVAAEELVLERFLELLLLAGVERPRVVLGFAGALDALLIERGGTGAAELAAAVVRRERRTARVDRALAQVVAEGVPDDPEALGVASAARLRELAALAGRLGERWPQIELRIDLAEFGDQVLDPRLHPQVGLGAYYDGLVFRAFGAAGAAPLGGGGRYDRLFRRLGAAVTAAGFSLSLDLLAEDQESEAEP